MLPEDERQVVGITRSNRAIGLPRFAAGHCAGVILHEFPCLTTEALCQRQVSLRLRHQLEVVQALCHGQGTGSPLLPDRQRLKSW